MCRCYEWQRANASGGRASLTLGGAADLEGIVVIFSQVTGLVKVVESRQKINSRVRLLT